MLYREMLRQIKQDKVPERHSHLICALGLHLIFRTMLDQCRAIFALKIRELRLALLGFLEIYRNQYILK